MRVRWPLGSTVTSSPCAQRSARQLAGVAAVVAAAGVIDAGRITHCTGKRAGPVVRVVVGDLDLLEQLQQRRIVVPVHRLRAVDDVVAVQRGDRDVDDLVLLARPAPVACAGCRRSSSNSVDDLFEARLRVIDEIHLVDRHHELGDAEQRADERVALGLLEHAPARVEQHDREVRRRGARDHVARVLPMTGAVGDDEPPPRRREVAVGDVDRDSLLALGAQAVGQQREVQRALAAAPLRWPARRGRAGPRRSTWCRTAAARSACSCRRRPSPPLRCAADRGVI